MPDLTALLRARSVAVIGASARAESFGRYLVRQLIDFGYPGQVYPIHPGYSEIEGVRCYASLEAVSAAIDCAAICVGDERIEEAIESVIATGVPAAVVFGSAAGVNQDGTTLTEWLQQRAIHADLALMGANCMGLFNFADRLFMTGYPYHREPKHGAIAFITHSGSIFSAVAKNTRGLDFNYVISPGQELVLTAADYLRFVVEQPETRVVGLFLEAVRDPMCFRDALVRAAERDIPVVLLKVGRTTGGARMALAHTGALAGAQPAIEALAVRHNVVVVRTIEEMLDTLELFNSGRRPSANGLGAITDSGGERSMMVDLASDLGIDFGRLADRTTLLLTETLDPGLEPANPVDLWGTGKEWQRVYRTCIGAMLSDDSVGAFNFGIDFNVGSRLGPDYQRIAIEAYHSTPKPFAVVTNVAAGINPDDAAQLRSEGVPVLMGAETGLLAFRHLFEYQAHRVDGSGMATGSSSGPNLSDSAEGLLAFQRPLTETESVAVLENGGLRGVAQKVVRDRTSAIEAAVAVGFPVVMKTAEPGMTHKSDQGGVIPGIDSVDSVRQAYDELSGKFGPAVVVQEMIATGSGVELFLGMTVDPQFGKLVTVGLGGIWIETLQDSLSFLAPCPAKEVERRLPRLRNFGLLLGARGREPVDILALATLVQQFSEYCIALGALAAEIDINPLYAEGDQFTMLDALIVPTAAFRSGANTD